MKTLLALLLLPVLSFAKPYPDPRKVVAPEINSPKSLSAKPLRNNGSDVLRVEVNWSAGETYAVSSLFLEKSGTPSLLRRALKRDPLGSYKAILTLPDGTKFHSSVGTGREFRQLVLTMSFRFPLTTSFEEGLFELEAEHPETGVLQKVLSQKIKLTTASPVPAQEVKVSLLRKALKEPSIKVNFYAEGFTEKGEARFLASAGKAIATLEQKLPGSEFFEFRAVFATSALKIGPARDLGNAPLERDSFLGLYFPHWRKFGRWYHVVYPTNQTRYRNALAQLDYDYPIALVDDSDYWGVGNYKELTAVPVDASAFSYLLLHEFGHFMGLNEEYEGGGPTELEFAKGILEPWSQNITFHPTAENLKWMKHTAPGIPLPSSRDDYERHGGSQKNPVGAFKGGYADSEPRGKSHKPVLKCMMGSDNEFCPVCSEALTELVDFDRH